MKLLYKNNKFKILAPTLTGEFELPDGLCSVSDIQDYFEYILKNMEQLLIIFRNFISEKIENRITFKVKTEYYLELLMPETMTLLWSTKSKITKIENGENVPHVKINEVILLHCNIVNNDYQQDSGVLYTFVPNKSFDQLLDILPKIFIFLKTLNLEFSSMVYRSKF